MARSDVLRADRRRYERLLQDIEFIEQCLNNASSNMRNAANNIASCYSIDGTGADNGQIKRCVSDINSVKNDLRNVIIPELNRKVSRLNYQIQEAIQAERVGD